MSWHFSLALVEEFSAANSSDGEPSAPSRSTATAAIDSCSDRTKDTSSRSRFGTTCEPSTGDRGQELLTWFLGDSLARTFQAQDRGPASAERAPASGLSSLASSEKSGQGTRSLKTRRIFVLADLSESSRILPAWGTMQGGVCSELPTSERRTDASECGFLPTPTAQCYGSNKGGSAGRVGKARHSLQSMARTGMWPTPTVCGNYNRKGASARSGDGLATAVGGTLSVDWTEWLMGWPIGWTACEPLETDKFRQWLRSHGEPSPHLLPLNRARDALRAANGVRGDHEDVRRLSE